MHVRCPFTRYRCAARLYLRPQHQPGACSPGHDQQHRTHPSLNARQHDNDPEETLGRLLEDRLGDGERAGHPLGQLVSCRRRTTTRPATGTDGEGAS